MFPEILSSPKAPSGYDKFFEATPNIKATPFILYSAHDYTIGPLLATFGQEMIKASDEHGDNFPPYASAVVLEVSEGKMTQHILLTKTTFLCTGL